MKPLVVAVVGSKKSGKTTTIEALTRELTKRNCRVAAVKHIPEPNFTIDTQGKDTWRFALAGAKTVVGVSADEIATIEKTSTKGITLAEILKRCEGNDVVFLEGFRELSRKDSSIPKIVVVKSDEEAVEAQKTFKPILLFSGHGKPKNTGGLSSKYVDALSEPEKLASIVEDLLKTGRRS